MRPVPVRIHHPAGHAAQRGIVSAAVMLFVITSVVMALALMLTASSSNVGDGQEAANSTDAFFLAESGIERATATVRTALTGTFTNASCTAAAGSVSLGRGTIVTTAVSTPTTCNTSTGPLCTICTVTATGAVANSRRSVTQALTLTLRNGTFCNGSNGDCSNTPTPTWSLNLKNTATVAGIGVFNLTYIGQGNNTPTCAPGSNCRLEQNLGSPSNGQNSTGLMGNAVLIPAGTTYPIYQTMSKGSNNLAEVGVFFLGTSAPSLTGPDALTGSAAFWNNNKSAAQNTVGSSGATAGATNDGTFSSTATCSRPSANSQSCNSWCYGGDTLVYSFAGNVTALTDALTAVTFNSGAGGQNVAMTQVAKYPTTLVAGAPANLDAEIWYASNPNFVGTTPTTSPASSYKGRGTASIGATWTSNGSDTTAISGTTLTVGASFVSALGYPSQIISVGDSVSESGGSGSPTCTTNCGTIVSQISSTETGGALGGRGKYQLNASNTVASANNRVWTIKSTVLHVTACTICDMASGDALTTLVSGTLGAQASPSTTYGSTEVAGGVGRYATTGFAAKVVPPSTTLYAGTPGATIYLPSAATSSQPPASAVLPMLVKVFSGTGAVAAGTKVTASSSPNAATTAMTVSLAPTTPLDNATLCGGTCAMFVTNGTTPFSITPSTPTANFNEWASAFMCLKGVDITPQVVTSSTSVTGSWSESVAP